MFDFFYITPNRFTHTETKEDLTMSACYHRAMIHSLFLSSDENDQFPNDNNCNIH